MKTRISKVDYPTNSTSSQLSFFISLKIYMNFKLLFVLKDILWDDKSGESRRFWILQEVLIHLLWDHELLVMEAGLDIQQAVHPTPSEVHQLISRGKRVPEKQK